jgi:hypothetical protein
MYELLLSREEKSDVSTISVSVFRLLNSDLKTRTDTVLETLAFSSLNYLAQLVAREDCIRPINIPFRTLSFYLFISRY